MNNKLVNITGASTVLLGVFSSFYHGPGQEFVHSYLHDFTLPFSMYFAYNLILKRLNGAEKALFLFGGCSAFEIAQRFGLYHGTYDPKDFLAYAAGAGLAYALENYLLRGKISERNLKQSDKNN